MVKEKEIVYWGTGMIAKMLLEKRKDITPAFFLSSFEEKDFLQKKVYRPNEIKEWDNLFIVIASLQIEEIEKQLIKLNLQKNIDYAYYSDLVALKSYDELNRDISQIEIKEDDVVTLFTMPVSKRAVPIYNFYKQYKKCHDKEKCVVICYSYGQDLSRLEYMNCELLECPSIFNWDGVSEIPQIEQIEKGYISKAQLEDDEIQQVYQIEEIFYSSNKQRALDVTAYQYERLKKVFDMLKPRKVFLWADNYRGSKIMESISSKRGIPYCFLEWGWIPGTIQRDRRGIGGRSEFVAGDSKLNKIEEYNEKDMDSIFEYIRRNHMDSGIFKETNHDKEVIDRLSDSKKTIFFAGMGDGKKIFNCKSQFWRNEISSIFESSKDALLYLAEICRKNDWQLIYKEHPATPAVYDSQRDGYGDVIFEVKDMEIYKILEYADVVTCFHSAIEFTALINNKPLVQLGHSMLSVSDCTYKPMKKNELKENLQQAITSGMTKEQQSSFKKFVYNLLVTSLWDDKSEKEIKYGVDMEHIELL